jgi:hypothetical protein
MSSGSAADKFIHHDLCGVTLSRDFTRKVYQCVCTFGAAGILYLASNATTSVVIVGLIYLSMFFDGHGAGGYRSSYCDLVPTPATSSMVQAFGNTIGSVPGIISPLITTALTTGANAESFGWHAVFAISIGLNVLAGTTWVIAGSSEPLRGL